jgi:hypothetical protein
MFNISFMYLFVIMEILLFFKNPEPEHTRYDLLLPRQTQVGQNIV